MMHNSAGVRGGGALQGWLVGRRTLSLELGCGGNGVGGAGADEP